MDSVSEAAQRARIRSSQIGARIRELHERLDWLTEARLSKTSTPDQVARAAHFAQLAQLHATEAAEHSVSAHLNAACAHERTADMLETLADAGRDDRGARREQARKHRIWAQADRDAARASPSHVV